MGKVEQRPAAAEKGFIFFRIPQKGIEEHKLQLIL